jgi:hypothetical protein
LGSGRSSLDNQEGKMNEDLRDSVFLGGMLAMGLIILALFGVLIFTEEWPIVMKVKGIKIAYVNAYLAFSFISGLVTTTLDYIFKRPSWLKL